MTTSLPPSVTTGSSSSTTNDEGSSEQGLRQRYVSRHRQVLEFIKTDAAESRPHKVPSEEALEDPLPRRASAAAASLREKTNLSQWLELPMWSWLKTYDYRHWLLTDLVAGLTVGVMVIPQSMSYAKLAGLPVEFGLYSALVPVYAYALFGTSRQLAVGPVALISLMLSTGLGKILKDEYHSLELDSPEYKLQYQQLAIQTSFLVGVVYIAMGLCRLGFVTIFLSHAVISGFTTGAAVIIGMSQVKYLFDIKVTQSDHLYELVHSIALKLDEFNWKTFVFGSTSIAALVALKTIGKHYPRFKWVRAAGPITVTTVSIVLTVLLDLQDKGIPVVGHIPKGLPKLTVSEWTPIQYWSKLMVVVISISIVGFMESIAIAKQLASKHKYDIDASTELIGLGMAVRSVLVDMIPTFCAVYSLTPATFVEPFWWHVQCLSRHRLVQPIGRQSREWRQEWH
jgi:sulfate transporter 4